MNKKALIAMSGGVDSSVAALLMLQKGFACTGVTMKLFNNEDIGLPIMDSKCCSLDDIADARSVCAKMGIEHYTFNYGERFRKEVIERFINAYINGETPNPCIDCNRYLKFGELFSQAQKLACDYVVTGHYARIKYDEARGRYLLLKALDPQKEQRYVLYSLTQQQLAHVQFPLGELTKPQVRSIAGEYGFVNAQKHDSQDICFIREGTSYVDFIEQHTGRKFPPGNFITADGKILGRHRGIIHYTVGQRKGLGLALPEPMYVQSINPVANTVTLSDNAGLFTASVKATDINLIDCERIDAPRRVQARIRYHQKEQWATVTQPDANTLQLEFDEPQRAITKGQALVMYDGDVVVGGGRIV